jgi:hypothetical protein
MRRRTELGLMAAVAGIALSLPPLRVLLEQSMAWHMLVQMPALVMAGWFLSYSPWSKKLLATSWNRYGLTGFTAMQAVMAYWMLPSAIDRAVVVPLADAAKVTSLLFAGALLSDSMQRSPRMLQLFFVGYIVSMLAWLGLYFVTTEVRLCNAYSLSSQIITGKGLVLASLGISVAWLYRSIVARSSVAATCR